MTRSAVRSVLAAATVAGALGVVALAPAGPASGAAASATVRVDGIGPLKLGMTRAAAVKTGWLSGRTTGCELGGKPYPLVYQLNGKAAPAAVEGAATFANGRLTIFTFTAGVRTANGTTPGVTTLQQAKVRFSKAPYSAQITTSQLDGSRFLRVLKSGKPAYEAFTKSAAGTGPVSLLGVPYVPICD